MSVTKSTSKSSLAKQPLFTHVYRELRRKRMIVLDQGSAHTLWETVLLSDVNAPLAEVGVYRGGSARIMLLADGRKRPLLLFDTFSGMPPISQHDVAGQPRYHATSVNKVVNDFADCPHVIFYPGMVHDAVRKVKGLKFSVVHIDTACYQGTRDALAFFGEHMAPGGLILVHGMGDLKRVGVTHAVMEWAQAKDRCVDLSVERYACIGLV